MALVNPFLAPEAEPTAPPVAPAGGKPQAAPSGLVNPFLAEQRAANTPDDLGTGVATPPGRAASILGSFAQGGARMLADIPREVGLQTSRSAVDTLGFFDSVDSGGDFNRLAARADTPGKMSYLRGNEQERAALRDEAKKAVAAPQQSAFYKAGEAMDAWVAKNAPTNPEYEKEFWSGKVPAGLGSMFAFMGEGLLMRRPLERAGLSRKQAVGGGALAGGTTSQAVSGFQDAIEKGASLEDAFKSHDLNRILGASEAVPIASILDRIDKGTGGLIKRTLINGMKGGTEEAIQESFQNIISNLIASDVVKYDPQRGMWTGTGEGAAVGFTTGGLVSVLGTLMFGRRANVGDDNQTPLTPEQQQAADSLLTPSVSGPIERTTPPAAATAPTATAAAPDMAALAEAPPATEQTPAAQTPASRPMVGVALSEQPADGLSVEVTDANGTVDPAAPGTPVVDPVAEAAPANAATTEQASVGLDLTALGNEVVDQESIATKAPQEVVEQPADAVTDTVLMDPDDISVDAQRFQFKGGTDAQGVSPQLKGVRKWDSRASGVSVVWEDQQGQRFVVDGHQRVALAKRLKAEGQAPKVRAIVLREADGITPAEARFIGAIKNLQEGGESTSATDVARVIREGGRVEQVADVIPPQRAAFKDGVALAKLPDTAWGAVLNNQLDPAFAAEVGRRITDPAQQNGAVQALIRAEPENAAQARMMVDQIINVGFKKGRQTVMFGEDDVAESLLKERAKVLDTALKRLRGMKRVFSAAVTGETDLSGAGNVLNTEANKEAADRNARIAETIARSANTVGDISNALTDAARAVSEGKPATQAAREFLDAIAGTAEARGQPAGQDQEGGSGDQVTIGGYPVGGLGEKALKTAAENATDPAERKAAQDELARRSKGVAEPRDSFELTPPTKTALQQEEERVAKAEKAERDRERAAEKRRKADKEAAQFELTGSKRPADATPRQTDLVSPKSGMLPTGSAYEAIKTRPGTTAAQKEAGQSALAAAERRIFGAVRTGVRKATTLLGSVISKDFRAQGFVSFTGKTIRSSRDLAILAQVVRDPRFETFRVIFVNGAGNIIDEHVMSSRLPGAVHFPQNMPEIIAARAEKIGATGYYLLHNHPTGRPDASSDDLRLTSQFARGAPGFKSHVILDHNEYNTLSMLPSGLVGEKIVRDESLASVDLKASPEVPHHLLGEKIGSPKDAAAIGAMLKSATDVVVVVGTGADGKITGITEMTRRDFLLATAKGAGQRRLRNVVAAKRFMRETGATRLFAVVPDNPRRYFGAQQSGLFTDIVGMDGESTASNMMAEPRSFASAAELRGGKSYVGEPAFENDLIIQHNLTAENVLHADRMGGLAVPSLAVTTVTRPLNNFGGITLLGDRDLADPRRGTQVFGADIYSPRYPTVTYKLDAAARRRLEAALKPHVEKLGDGVGTVTRLDDLTDSRAFRRYAEKMAGHTPNYDERVGIAEQLLRDVLADETLFKGFTNTGRRYVPHTLDNVVKALKKDLRGGEGFNYGLPNLRAKVTPRFRSVEAIRKSKDKLVTRAAFEAVRDEMNAGLDDLAARISADIGSDRSTDTVVQVLTDAVSMGLPRALRENNVPRPSIETQQAMTRFLAKLRDMPTEYFEAIIPRVAQFSEFKAAVVPTGTDPRAVAVLRGAGLKIVEYEKGNDIQRQGAIERAAQDDGLLFSRAAPVDTNSPAFKRWFKGSQVINADGKPLMVYHGTRGDFSEFDPLRTGTASDAGWYGSGFYFTPDPTTASTYAANRDSDGFGFERMREGSDNAGANVIPAYVSLQNPYDWRSENTRGLYQNSPEASVRKRAELEALGHDGVLVFRDIIQIPDGGRLSDEQWAALSAASPTVTDLGRDAVTDLFKAREWTYRELEQAYGVDVAQAMLASRSRRILMEVVAFRPEQIKSAISNTGEFSDTNPDITASRGTGPAAGRTVAAVEAEIEQQIGRSAYAKLRDRFVVVADTAALRDDMQRRGSKFTGMLYAKAFHGTPHIWAPEPGFPHGRPRLDKIGTGEGAAAFGWGWYGAESDAVGKEYKKVTPSALVPPIRTFKGEEITPGSPEYHAATLLEAAGKTLAGAKNEVRGWIKGARPGEDVTHYRAVLAVLDGAASKKDFGVKKATGQLYALDIPDDALPYLLDRDKALGEQTPEVRKSLEQTPPWRDGGSLIEAFDQYITGQALYAVISHRLGGDRAASEYLASIGIVGNRYRDAGSRGDTSTPTYNYVIWDQKTLDRIALLERNGEKLDAIRERERADAGADIAASRTADEAGRIKGLYDFSTDTSYIVAGSLTAQDSPWGVFLHEVGEHYGLERMLGEAGHKAVLRQAEALLRAGVKPIRAAAEQVNASENVGLSPKAASFNRQFAGRMRKDPRLAREVIAYLAESPANHNMPLMRRIIASVRAFLRRLGIVKNLTTDDIVTLVIRSARRAGEFSRRTAAPDAMATDAMDALRQGGYTARQERGIWVIRDANGKAVEDADIPDSLQLAATIVRYPAMRSALAPIWYSQLGRTLATKLPGKGPAAQMRQAIEAFQKKGEFKAEELEWSGLPEWLDAQTGTVTRDDILDVLTQNSIEVRDVVLSDQAPIEWSAERQRDGMWQVRGNGTDIDTVIADTEQEAIDQVKNSPNLDDLLADYPDTQPAGRAKFAAYQLPGGTNYREVLLTLPGAESREDAIKRRDAAAAAIMAAPGYPEGLFPTRMGAWAEENAPELFREWADASSAANGRPTESNKNTFQSGHFQQPNIIAHVRLNDRTDANGNKVLFVEEVQSDWHNEGRKHGYQAGDLLIDGKTAGEWQDEAARRFDAGDVAGMQEASKKARTLRDRARDRGLRDGRAVPDAPFKQSWPMLAMKRVLRMAVEGGYDSVAWVTGEQTQDRYDLSKKIERIHYEPTDGGRYELIAYKLGSKDDSVGSEALHEDEISIERVEELLGRDIAQKIKDGAGERIGGGYRDWHELKGVDLKVGGEWAVNLYDKQIPNELNKYVKKWGGRVGQADVKLADMPWAEYDKYPPDHPYRVKNAPRVHSLPITPAMRDAISLGQPLFSRVRGTPAQEQAIEATIGPAPGEKRFGRFLASLADGVGNVGTDRIRQGLFDQFRSIAAYEERANAGVVMDAATSAWKMALTTKNLHSVVTAMMVHGPVELVNGEFRLMVSRKGLIDIFKPLADKGLLRLWEGWAAANRAQRLMAEGRERNFSQAQITALLDLENQYPEFRAVLAEYQDFNKAVLDMAEAAGVIDPAARAIWERNDYVPFYRIIEDAQDAMGPSNRRGIAKQQSGIRKLRGGEQHIGSVLENIVMNMAHMVDAAYKNEAMRRTVELTDGIGMHAIEKDWRPTMIPDAALKKALEAHGVNVDTLTPAQRDQWSQIFSRVAPQGPDVVWVLKAGKPAYYRVTDPLLLRSVLSFGPSAAGAWMKMLKTSRTLLTKGVTATPEFMAANFVRDTLSTWVVSDRNLVPIGAAASGFVKALIGSSDAMHDMMTMGGLGRGFYDVDPQNLRRSMEEKAHLRPVGIIRTLWRLWQRVGFAFEQANRIAIFEATRKKGGSRAEAAHQARDIMDFSMRGDWAVVQFLADTVPFLNARLQGLYKLGRGAAEHPVGFFIKGSLLTAATLMLLAANDDDDRYNALPEWEKDLYWHFWIDDDHFKIPKPFEIGALFATIPERVLRAASGRDANKTTRQAAMRMVSDTFAFNPIPQLFKPIIEDAMNYNLFMDRPIVPMRLARLPPEMQYDPWTSESLRELSAIMPPGPLRSPKRFEHLVRGYFGSVATYLTGIADRVVRAAVDSPQEPSGRATDIPVVGRFYKGSAPGQTRYTEVFYDMLDEAETAAGAVRELRRQGRMAEANDVALKNADVLRARLTLARQARMLTEINKRVRLVYYSTDMTPDQKRAKLDELSRMKDGIIRSTVERFER